jgi:hypothetical protein
MAALANRAVGADQLVELLKEAERFVFLVSRLCRRRADAGDNEFYRLASQIYKEEVPPVRAIEAITTRTLKLFDVRDAEREVAALFDDDGDGFYDWGALKYFLFEYERHLQVIARGGQKISWDDFTASKRDVSTIEHIYPQTPKQAEWPEFGRLPPEQSRAYRNSLGNLLALARAKNSALRNGSFAQKCRPSDDSPGYATGSYSEIDVARNDSWGPTNVETRGLRMLAFMEERWRFHFPDDTSKMRFLHLR